MDDIETSRRFSELGARIDTLRALVDDERIDALRELVNEREDRTKERFTAMDKSVSAALSAADKAVTKAELATEKRFEGVNEFRETLRDQAANLMPRAEYDVQHKALQDVVSNLNDRMGSIENRAAGATLANADIRSVNKDTQARTMAVVAVVVTFIIGLADAITRLFSR